LLPRPAAPCATREGVIDAAKIGVEFGGGPAFVGVRNNLLEFLDELEAT
jgi:hypothetical protein